MRIMGLDIGTKRIGVALSDELLLTAQGRDSIERKDLKSDLEKIDSMAVQNGVSEIVAGLPISMNGSHSAKTKEVMEFIDKLAAIVKVPVRKWDERLTSLQAENIMLEGDMSRSKRRRLSDKIAAQLILQNYLDFMKASKRVEGEKNV
ncbi:MAG: Holliday junction resolvase RuvX [Candidatus Omnitrophica bacterium]|nr:Holliday junction resolvase RuvX [Candidatus Omnitrophota bacterium]